MKNKAIFTLSAVSIILLSACSPKTTLSEIEIEQQEVVKTFIAGETVEKKIVVNGTITGNELLVLSGNGITSNEISLEENKREYTVELMIEEVEERMESDLIIQLRQNDNERTIAYKTINIFPVFEVENGLYIEENGNLELTGETELMIRSLNPEITELSIQLDNNRLMIDNDSLNFSDWRKPEYLSIELIEGQTFQRFENIEFINDNLVNNTVRWDFNSLFLEEPDGGVETLTGEAQEINIEVNTNILEKDLNYIIMFGEEFATIENNVLRVSEDVNGDIGVEVYHNNRNVFLLYRMPVTTEQEDESVLIEDLDNINSL